MNDCESIIESFAYSHPDSNIKTPDSLIEAYIMYNNLSSMNYEIVSNMDEAINEYNLRKINDRITQLTEESTRFTWPYSIAPYFTEEEIPMYEGFYYDEHMINQLTHDDTHKTLHQRVIDLRDQLRDAEDPDEITRIKQDLEALGFTPDDAMKENTVTYNTQKHFEPVSWDKKLRTLMAQLKGAENTDDIAFYKQEIINMGWNPEIEYSTENKVLAKKRIESIYQERYCSNPPLDIQWLIENSNEDEIFTETSKEELKPIYIVLIKGKTGIAGPISKITRSDFSHSAICIDNDFKVLYSYNFVNGLNKFGGFSVETVDNVARENRLAVFGFFVTIDTWIKIKERINMLTLDINNTSYSIINALTIPFKRINPNMPENMICSQFVDSILKMAEVDITGINSSKVTPETLYQSAYNDNKIYKVFDGIAKDFDAVKVEKYMAKMAKKAKPYNESGVSWISSIMEDYIYPVVCESKSTSTAKEKSKKDVLITRKDPNLSYEYDYSHKNLNRYNKANDIEGIKYELARLYYINYLLKQRVYSKKYAKDKEYNSQLRAKIFDDYVKYILILTKHDPFFSFGRYYKETKFYDKTIETSRKKLIKSKDMIDYIL